MLNTLAEIDSSLGAVKEGWGNLIFMGGFFIALIIVAVWWLRRG